MDWLLNWLESINWGHFSLEVLKPIGGGFAGAFFKDLLDKQNKKNQKRKTIQGIVADLYHVYGALKRNRPLSEGRNYYFRCDFLNKNIQEQNSLFSNELTVKLNVVREDIEEISASIILVKAQPQDVSKTNRAKIRWSHRREIWMENILIAQKIIGKEFPALKSKMDLLFSDLE